MNSSSTEAAHELAVAAEVFKGQRVTRENNRYPQIHQLKIKKSEFHSPGAVLECRFLLFVDT